VKITKSRLKQIIKEELAAQNLQEWPWSKEPEEPEVPSEKYVPSLSPRRRVFAKEIVSKHAGTLDLFIEWLVKERKLPEAVDWQKRFVELRALAATTKTWDYMGDYEGQYTNALSKIEEIITEFPYGFDNLEALDCVELMNLLDGLPQAFLFAPSIDEIKKFQKNQKPEKSKTKPLSWTQRWRQRGLLPENESGETPYQKCAREIEASKQTQRDMAPFLARAHTEKGVDAEEGWKEAERWRDANAARMSEGQLEQIIREELTKTDKADIKKMISKELKDILEDELVKALKTKDIKSDIGEVAKKVIKKLYKDLSFHHPYIIDRIKV